VISRLPTSDYGPHTANFTMYVPITYENVLVNTQISVVDFIRGVEEQTVTLTSYQVTFPRSLAKHLTEVADGRV
jgi:hypothetical protein